jgi:tRNA nucleotidyltransferase (CCA-adding enzyme)
MRAMPKAQSTAHLTRRLPRQLMVLLRQLGRMSDEAGIRLYLVGGVVRDLLLKREIWDLDLTIEGDGIAFARLVADCYGAGLAVFDRFATARLTFSNGLKVDIASTRSESYVKPAALPNVQPATLQEDLYRRDFTINAMALQLNAEQFGQLYDPYGGQRDLKAKLIRVLHEGSFIDDPTRIFRAIRFVERFGFALELKTSQLLKQAAATNMIANLSGPRLANEIFLLMQEGDPSRAIESLRRRNLLRFLHPQLRDGKQVRRLIMSLPRALAWWKQQCPGQRVNRGLLYLMTIVSSAGTSIRRAIARRLQLSTRETTALEWAGDKTGRTAKILLRRRDMLPSEVYRLLLNMPDEAVALVLAKGLTFTKKEGVRPLRMRLLRFMKQDRSMTTIVNGEDLKRLGLKPGPHFKTILDRLLDERLDGRITGVAQERDRARTLVERYG